MAKSVDDIIEHHTLHGRFGLSNGGVAEQYTDLRAALLCAHCGDDLRKWYDRQLEEFDAIPVATGAFGAMLIGWMSPQGIASVLWNPKGHGVEWSGALPYPGTDVALVDDVVTTGGTLRAMRAACERQGWNVVVEIVAKPALVPSGAGLSSGPPSDGGES